MLNVGMSELLVFAIIALLVLGPEKIPEAARFLGKWYGKVKRFIGKVQNEIDQELQLSEFRAEMQQEIERLTALEVRMHQQLEALKNTKIVDSAEQQANKKMLAQFHYQPFTQKIIPYSMQFVQLALAQCLQLEHTAHPPSTLKIAV